MKIVVLLLIATSFCITEICAQTLNTSENAFKYWYYRDRLKYFVMPGTQPGQSILCSRRNPSTEEHWDGTEYTMDIDQPRMMMGFYIGLLATEYKLLKDNGQIASANATLSELNLALEALIRMDKCESNVPWNCSQDYYDGFFTRCDVPSETEVSENGLSLGESFGTLLRKIEELTLYVIDLKKENEELRKMIEERKFKYTNSLRI